MVTKKKQLRAGKSVWLSYPSPKIPIARRASITFSRIAAEILTAQLLGNDDPDEDLFRLGEATALTRAWRSKENGLRSIS